MKYINTWKRYSRHKVYQGKTAMSEQLMTMGDINNKIKATWKKLLAYAQNGERTKPPAMKIEGKSNVLLLQPHIGDDLDPINHLKNGAFGAFKQPIVSFLPDFPNCCIPNNL